MTWQIDSGYFCAGFTTCRNCVDTVAPIIKYMRGWGILRVTNYCRGKGWKLTVCVEAV